MFTSKKASKKSKFNAGFTLTEMVIVIAVIAILAAVLIPTFIGVANRAKLSADVQAASNATTIAKTVVSGKSDASVQEIWSAIANEKIDLTKTQSSNYRFAYDSNSNEVVLLNENLEIVENERVSTATGTNLWFFVQTSDNIISADKLQGKRYASNYFLTQNYTGTLQINTLSSFDTGSSTFRGNVNYGTTTTTIAGSDNVTVSGTINGTLFINASAAEFTQNGTVTTINAKAVAQNSLKINGNVQNLTINTGHVKVEQNAIVKTIFVPNNASAKITNNGYITKLAVKEGVNTSNLEVTNNAVIQTAVQTQKENVVEAAADTATTAISDPSIASETQNTQDYQYSIASFEQLCAFRDAVNDGARFVGVTVALTSDIALETGWTPIGAFKRDDKTAGIVTVSFAGTFDGQNHTISNLNNAGYTPTETYTNSSTMPGKSEYVYGLFGAINSATIKNLKLTNVNIDIANSQNIYGDKVGAIVGYSNGDLVLTNCQVSGSISAFDGVGGLVGGAYGPSLNITNCINNASVTGAEKAAGIVGYASSPIISIQNTTNNGAVLVTYQGANAHCFAEASGIIILNKNDKNITLNTVTNNGSVTVDYVVPAKDKNGNDVTPYKFRVFASAFVITNQGKSDAIDGTLVEFDVAGTPDKIINTGVVKVNGNEIFDYNGVTFSYSLIKNKSSLPNAVVK